MKKEPELILKPQLTQTYTRERYFQDAFDKNKSISAKESRIRIVSRLDHYCLKVHNMQPEEVFEWIKKESKTPEMVTQ